MIGRTKIESGPDQREDLRWERAVVRVTAIRREVAAVEIPPIMSKAVSI